MVLCLFSNFSSLRKFVEIQNSIFLNFKYVFVRVGTPLEKGTDCLLPFFSIVPAILSEAVPATTQNVQTEIQNTTKLAFRYTGECSTSG